MVERKRKLDAELSGTFEDITQIIQRLVDENQIGTKDAKELSKKLNQLRKQTVSGPVDIESVIDQMDVIVLNPTFKSGDRGIGWLVDTVKDVKMVTKDDLDSEVGGAGVYGVLRENEDDEEKDIEELTVWINPKEFF